MIPGHGVPDSERRHIRLADRAMVCASAPAKPADFELRNMLTVARLIVEAALQRRESRGAHHRADFPEPSAEWQRHVVIGRGG